MDILIFGYGNRVQTDILSALEKSIEHSKIYIITKSSRPKIENNSNIFFYNFNEFYKLADISFDITIISVPLKNQVEVLKVLKSECHKQVYIDTPIHSKVLKYTKKFKINVLEDIIKTPIVREVKKLITNAGKIDLYFFKSAHEYHGIAMVEALLGINVTKKKRVLLNLERIKLNVILDNLHHVTIISPSNSQIGYVKMNTSNDNYYFGNEDAFKDDHNNSFKDYIKLETVYKLYKLDGSVSKNWISDLGNFKQIGLIEIFKNRSIKNFAQTPHDSIRQQRIAKSNKFTVKLKKLIYTNLRGVK